MSGLPWALGAAVLATYAIGGVLARTGEPAVPLDDSYIHFQYAKAIARGAPFEYTPGATPTPGATSVLWPVLLAPFSLVLEGTRIIWAAWALGWLFLAMLAHETRKLAEGLVSSAGSWLAGLSVLCFGGFAWFATSGMEVVPFAWLLCRTARRGAEWWEVSSGEGPRVTELVVYAWLLPLARPEGLAGALAVAAALLFRRNQHGLAPGAVAATSLFGPSAIYLLLTGSAVSSTAAAKWLPMNPYVDLQTFLSYVSYNSKLFFGTLLDGRLWTSVFLPDGGRVLAWAALGAVPIAGFVSGRRGRGVVVLLLALGALLPTTYETFLVNRVRYIWPFTSGWLIGLVALCDLPGRLVTRFHHAGRAVSVVLAGLALGLLASRIPPSVTDLSESAGAVHDQQVSLGRWVRDHLPEDARVGLNDTGAIAYFGGRTTFDIVGLTTADEARFWSAGAGSRFEHYERLAPDERPTHFVVYPEWFAADPLLGEWLTSRTVHATILGGPTMSAYVANYDALGSAHRPVKADGKVVDRLDVADLESEQSHDYALFDATQRQNVVVEWQGMADGARLGRLRDRFDLRLAPDDRLVLRVAADEPVALSVSVDGQSAGHIDVSPSAWQEHVVAVHPAIAPQQGDGAERRRIEVTAHGGRFGSLHYFAVR